MNFRKPTIADIDTLSKYLDNYTGRRCDLSPGNIVFWRKYYNFEISFDCNCLILRGRAFEEDAETEYFYPIGERADEVLDKIISNEKSSGASGIIFACLDGVEKDKLLEKYPDADAFFDRDWCDYLYDAQSIVTLKGKKLSGQRNHINKFRQTYENWSFEEIGEDIIPLAKSFYDNYFADIAKQDSFSDEEKESLYEQLALWDKYGQHGGILTVTDSEGEKAVVGISVGETVGDTLIVHTEKADTSYAGAYPMLTNCFARSFVKDKTSYINREEDCGVEGLRTSKLSYHPISLLEKWNVTLKF